MTHAATTAGGPEGVWAYCVEVDCNWMGPVHTPADPQEGGLPWWANAFYDIDRHQKHHV